MPLYSTLLALDDEHGPADRRDRAAGPRPGGLRRAAAWAPGGTASPHGSATTATLDGAYLSSSSFSHWPDADLLGVKHAGCQLRTWGDGYGYALVATGRVDAMVDHVVEVYDVAPMPVILAEAGGRFTSFAGAPVRPAAAASPPTALLHDELLARARRLRSRSDPALLAQVAEQGVGHQGHERQGQRVAPPSSSSGMCSKFMPHSPASRVGTATMATHPEMRRMSSFCCTDTCVRLTVQHLGQQVSLDLDAGDAAPQVVVHVAEVRPEVDATGVERVRCRSAAVRAARSAARRCGTGRAPGA